MEVFVIVKTRHDVDGGKFEVNVVGLYANKKDARRLFDFETTKAKQEFSKVDSNQEYSIEDHSNGTIETFQIEEVGQETTNYCTIKLQKKIL